MKPWEAIDLRLGSVLCRPYKWICTVHRGHAWLTRSFVQTKPRRIAPPSLNWSATWSGTPCRRLTSLPSRNHKTPQNRWETPWRPNSHPMAIWTLCHVGCHSHWHRIVESYLNATSCSGASAANPSSGATEEREVRCNFINHLFFHLAFETFEPINQAGRDFLSPLSHRLSLVSDNPRKSSFLFQRHPAFIQRFNSVSFCESIGSPIFWPAESHQDSVGYTSILKILELFWKYKYYSIFNFQKTLQTILKFVK